MFERGLVDEVRELRDRGFGETEVVTQGIAYAEAGKVLDGEMEMGAAIERSVIRTRQYAKRQRTFIRGRDWDLASKAHIE
jgi:tRNA dimethylallyltransferase